MTLWVVVCRPEDVMIKSLGIAPTFNTCVSVMLLVISLIFFAWCSHKCLGSEGGSFLWLLSLTDQKALKLKGCQVQGNGSHNIWRPFFGCAAVDSLVNAVVMCSSNSMCFVWLWQLTWCRLCQEYSLTNFRQLFDICSTISLRKRQMYSACPVKMHSTIILRR